MKQKIVYGNGNCLAYAEYGDPNGYPILIQHGLIASIDDNDLFDSLIPAGARLICTARPGYGESSPYLMSSYAEWADILSPLIDKVELVQFDVLGISSGAPYSYAIGNGFPENVRNIYILSGIPALYDEEVRSQWPYPVIKEKDMATLQSLAHVLFFSHLTADSLSQNDIRDSMANDGFGVAQDLRLRFMEWGFSLSAVKASVFMRHSKSDEAVPFPTAIRTAELLPHCDLCLTDVGSHFSREILNNFIGTTIVAHMETRA